MVGVDDKGDMRTRAIAELALAVEEDDAVGEAVQAARMAGLGPYEIAELSGLPMRRVLGNAGSAGGLMIGRARYATTASTSCQRQKRTA